jgi:Sulfotransferase family
LTFPDFIGIGAQKAGTTWLHRNLQAHPQIWMPKEKELHYFDEKIKQRGALWSRMLGSRPIDKRWRRQIGVRFKRLPRKVSRQDIAWDLRYFFKRPGDVWYASLFEQGKGRLTGETTPDYAILETDTIAHVHELMPHARIIFMMRSPIERPWSAMDMRLRLRGQSVDELKDRKFYRRFDNEGSRMRTDYLHTLENWGAFYPEEQIFVGFLEDIHFFPGELLKSLYRFLGVDPSVKYGNITRKIHPGLQDTIPTRFAVHLARVYQEEIARLSERFGGYASFWLYCANRLINDPPEEEFIPHPLWETAMWKRWIGEFGSVSERPRFQSGPLSSVQIAS